MEKNVEFFIKLFIARKMKPRPVALAGIGATAVILALDVATPREFSFSLFYLLPIAFGILLGGRKLGYVNAFLATLAFIAAQLLSGQTYSTPFFLAWAIAIRAASNAIFVYILDILKQVIEEFRELSLLDPLTGAANRRFFEGYLDRTIQRSRRDKQPLTLLALDFDEFKALNDKHGHDRGDEALMGLVRAIQGKIRPDDMLCRMGGDEFALVLYAMDHEKSQEVIARLMDAIHSELKARGIELSLSVGAISFATASGNPAAMLKRADELLYEVKRSGKNSIRHIALP